MGIEVVVAADADELAALAADRLVTRLAAAQRDRGTASVVLTGGGVGIAMLERIAAGDHGALDWSQVDVWWGDERYVPADSPDRNERQAREALLGKVPVDPARVHPMPADDGLTTPEDAASLYAVELGERLPRFDVLLLGVGPEGHTASIFPGSPAAHATGRVTAVRDCPKPPPTRISLTFDAIRSADEVWLVAAGAGKSDVLAGAYAGASEVDLPVAGALGRDRTLWLLDTAAAAGLPTPPQTT